MTQPGHAFEHRGSNPGDMGGIEGKRDLLSPPQPVCPVPQHHSSLLLVSSGNPAAGLGDRQMVAC